MLTIKKLKVAAAVAKYHDAAFEHAETPDSTGAPADELVPATWIGAASNELLAGSPPAGLAPYGQRERPTAQAFANLVHGITKDGQVQLSGRPGEAHVAGFDCLFLPDKTVSLAAFVPEQQIDVIAAHRLAVQAGIAELEKAVFYRSGGEHRPGKLLGCAFEHYTSRENDPHLHTHGFGANMTLASDGHPVAIDGKRLLDARERAEKAYNKVLSAQLKRLGYEIERGEYSPIIRGYTEEQVREFSRRSAQIEQNLRDHGLVPGETSHYAKQQANRATAAEKNIPPRAELQQDWAERGAAVGITREFAAGLRVGADRVIPLQQHTVDALQEVAQHMRVIHAKAQAEQGVSEHSVKQSGAPTELEIARAVTQVAEQMHRAQAVVDRIAEKTEFTRDDLSVLRSADRATEMSDRQFIRAVRALPKMQFAKTEQIKAVMAELHDNGTLHRSPEDKLTVRVAGHEALVNTVAEKIKSSAELKAFEAHMDKKEAGYAAAREKAKPHQLIAARRQPRELPLRKALAPSRLAKTSAKYVGKVALSAGARTLHLSVVGAAAMAVMPAVALYKGVGAGIKGHDFVTATKLGLAAAVSRDTTDALAKKLSTKRLKVRSNNEQLGQKFSRDKFGNYTKSNANMLTRALIRANVPGLSTALAKQVRFTAIGNLSVLTKRQAVKAVQQFEKERFDKMRANRKPEMDKLIVVKAALKTLAEGKQLDPRVARDLTQRLTADPAANKAVLEQYAKAKAAGKQLGADAAITAPAVLRAYLRMDKQQFDALKQGVDKRVQRDTHIKSVAADIGHGLASAIQATGGMLKTKAELLSQVVARSGKDKQAGTEKAVGKLEQAVSAKVFDFNQARKAKLAQERAKEQAQGMQLTRERKQHAAE